MKRESKTVWMSDDGSTELLVRFPDGKYTIPAYGLSSQKLFELQQAIVDALQTQETKPEAMAA